MTNKGSNKGFLILALMIFVVGFYNKNFNKEDPLIIEINGSSNQISSFESPKPEVVKSLPKVDSLQKQKVLPHDDPLKDGLNVVLPSGNLLDLNKDINWLALNIFMEAGNQNEFRMATTALVTRNRVLSKRFPNSYKDVATQRSYVEDKKGFVCHYSWLCEVNKRYKPDTIKITGFELVAWKRAVTVASSVYFGNTPDHTFGATHYFADYIEPPKWSLGMKMTNYDGIHLAFTEPSDTSFHKTTWVEYVAQTKEIKEKEKNLAKKAKEETNGNIGKFIGTSGVKTTLIAKN